MLKKLIMVSFGICISFMNINALAYYTKDKNIYDENGKIVFIDGVNWSGFQDNKLVDELYANIPLYPLNNKSDIGLMDMLTHPWEKPGETGVNKESGVGFKTIRLPIQPDNLHDDTPETHFRFDLTDAKHKTQGNGVLCDPQGWGEQTCEKGRKVSDELFQMIKEFQKSNLRVLVDFHQTPVGRDGNVVEKNYSLQDYQNDVAFLAKQIKQKKLDNVVGIDVFNEPHNLFWYKKNGDQPAWVEVIAATATAIYQNNPQLLLFVEGPASEGDPSIPNPICVSKTIPQDPDAYSISKNPVCGEDKVAVNFKADWGENFKGLLDEKQAIKGNPIFNIDKFRQAICKQTGEKVCDWLLGKSGDQNPVGHLVFSPHVYGQHVATWQTTPEASPYRFDWNFGFLNKAGFPVVIGETGYLPDQISDVKFFEKSIAPYLEKNKMNHNLFYWTFNTNSGDTGGVRADQNTSQLVDIKEQDLHDLFEYQ